MDWKRAVWIGAIEQVISFIVGLFFSSIFTIWFARLLYIIVSVIIAGVFASWYFKHPNITISAKDGFFFSLVLVVVDLLLSFIMSIGIPIDRIAYYSSPLLWVQYILVAGSTTLVGWRSSCRRKFYD